MKFFKIKCFKKFKTFHFYSSVGIFIGKRDGTKDEGMI